MAQNETTFSQRLERIESANKRGLFSRRRRAPQPGFVFHADGVVTRRAPPRQRLRFAFPLRGLIVAFVLIALVKSYMMWTLGGEVYGAAISGLLAGSELERAAGLIMAPDAVTLWMVDAMQAIYRFFGSMMTALEGVASSMIAV
ncbi:hypothetical protein N0B44_05295 [Roseibacterium beibuensis]|uniref:hypothetical protein n=1 Tax=[Roseibacterium] beibuensis TaxID=1193142 RepID=UPI00217DC90F|nr:hypothetical protein [Roseibacterium beibuensis]MCS6622320.1 hypothetical protein [Roseibacterium beibuensis]